MVAALRKSKASTLTAGAVRELAHELLDAVQNESVAGQNMTVSMLAAGLNVPNKRIFHEVWNSRKVFP